MFHIDDDNSAPAAAGGAAIDAANVGTIYAATVKLPDFWQNNPRSWFQHIEAQFQLRGITQDVTKYFHVVAALDAAMKARSMAQLEGASNLAIDLAFVAASKAATTWKYLVTS